MPWWGLVSSAAAPALLVGGWTEAARLQPRPVDPVADPVSTLAAVGSADRWVMTLTFAVVGVCYIVTAVALRPAGAAGRLILAAGAAAGMLVAVNPLPAHGGSPSHALWASVGFAALAVWRPARGSAVRKRRGGCGRLCVPASSRCWSSWWRGSAWRWSPGPGARAWPSGYWAWPRRSGR